MTEKDYLISFVQRSIQKSHHDKDKLRNHFSFIRVHNKSSKHKHKTKDGDDDDPRAIIPIQEETAFDEDPRNVIYR